MSTRNDWRVRRDAARSWLLLEDAGATIARMELIENPPHEVLFVHPRVLGDADPVAAAAALVEAGLAEVRDTGVARATLLLEGGVANADAFLAAAPAWGFALDVTKTLFRAAKTDLRLDAVPPVPADAVFAPCGPETAGVLGRVLAASVTESDRAADPRTMLAGFEEHARSLACLHREDWEVLRVGGTEVGLVLPSFADAKHEAGTNLYVGVVREAQGRGYGAMLERRGIETMLRRGAARIIGSCDVRNDAMARIFRRLGLSPVRTRHVLARRMP